MDQFDNIEAIGAGAYGKVYRARRKRDGREVALKKVKANSLNSIHSTTIREIGILKQLDHPHIVKLLEVISSPKYVVMVFEYAASDLKLFITRNWPRLDERWIRRVMFQLIKGAAYLHSRRILHRDLKSQNILVDPGSEDIKIADFGLARFFSLPSRAYTHEVVTLWYRAPEILLGMATYSPAVDMWSLGCIFTELVLGEPICRGQSEIDQLLKYFEILGTPNEDMWPGVEKLPFYIQRCPQWKPKALHAVIQLADRRGVDLLKKLLTYDPRKRISASAALEHSYFHDLIPRGVSDRFLRRTPAMVQSHPSHTFTSAMDYRGF